MIKLDLKGRDKSRKKKKEKYTRCNKASSSWVCRKRERRVTLGRQNWQYLAVDQKLCARKGRSQEVKHNAKSLEEAIGISAMLLIEQQEGIS